MQEYVHSRREIHHGFRETNLPEDFVPRDDMLTRGVEEDVRLLLGIFIIRVK